MICAYVYTYFIVAKKEVHKRVNDYSIDWVVMSSPLWNKF